MAEQGAVLPSAEDKAAFVRRMFGAIAPRYDLLNHLLSLNRDRAWRRRAADLLLAGAPHSGRFLDSCAGTLDLSCELAARPGFGGRVLACDFSLPMLERGGSKANGLPVRLICGDALRLPLPPGTLDGAMVGFGVRNLASLQDGLVELGRVVKPGGRLVILEFATPRHEPLRSIYLFYFRRLLPWIGGRVSRHGSAYSYLPASVLQFPEPADLARRIEAAGFEDVRWETRTGGIVAIHTAVRSQSAG